MKCCLIFFFFFEGESTQDSTKGFTYKIGPQLNMFKYPLGQKHFQIVALQDRKWKKTPAILDHYPLIWGLVSCSWGRAFFLQFSLNDSWKENAIQLNTLSWWTFITQLISPADVFIHSSVMSSTVPSVSIRLFS